MVGRADTVISFVTVVVQPLVVTVYRMVVVPAAIPVTTPDAFTVANAGALEVHAPPLGPVKVVVVPAHNDEEPVIAATIGIGLTVTLFDCVVNPQLLVTVN
jgi:hypothetical protein